jgi:hypothetical protein
VNQGTHRGDGGSPETDEAKGSVFPRMYSAGVIGVTRICSSVPISRSRTTAMLVSITVTSITMKAMIPGRNVKRLSRFSLNQARDAMETEGGPGRVPDGAPSGEAPRYSAVIRAA